MDSVVLSLSLSGLLLPSLLWAGGILHIPPGPRFKHASLILGILWCWISWCWFSTWQFFAGFLCIMGMLLFAFMVWSVLCWGYTLSMLLCFNQCPTIRDITAWQSAYAGPDGIHALSLNRTQVLTRFYLASMDHHHLTLTQAGRIAAIFFNRIQQCFGIPR